MTQDRLSSIRARKRAPVALSVAVVAALTAGLACGGGTSPGHPSNLADGGAGTGGQPSPAGGAGGEVACADGELTCACLGDGTCSEGECINDVCVDCTRGDADCLCRSTGSCGAGLQCVDGLCEACSAGEESCECFTDGSCGAGLVCADGICVSESCEDGAESCPCRADAPECNEGLVCSESSICEVCASDVPGCPCDASACTGGLVCDEVDSICRETLTCAELVADGTCVENQICVEGTGTDAGCVLACADGYQWNADACEECPAEGCGDPCDPDLVGGLWAACQAELRECVVDEHGVGGCGDCVADAEERDGECVPRIACGGEICTDDEYCQRDRATGTEACQALPCTPPQVADTSGACTGTCTLDCTGAGYTGRIWPYLNVEGDCVCETREGFFIEAGATGGAVQCDADRDGWVKRTATVDAIENDDALWQNRRCDIQSVDSVELVDEYGNVLTVRSCTNGLVLPAATCDAAVPIRLLETSRNDIESLVRLSDGVPQFGADGRKPRAAELNGLSKGCNHLVTGADYDDDGTTDYLQEQDTRDAFTDETDDQARLASFAYFMELYTAYYREPGASETLGTLVIAERSRCGAEFPLHYEAGDSAGGVSNSTYWRNCYRRRDASFIPGGSTLNQDFAQWSDDITGVPGPATATDLAWDAYSRPTVNGDLGPLPDYGLCTLDGAAAGDGVWRGMHHHSQFKCEMLESDSDLSDFARLYASFNTCAAKVCEPDAVDCEESRAIGTDGALEPIIECSVGSPTVGAVGWGLVAYQPYGAVYREAGGGMTPYDIAPAGLDESLRVYDRSQDYTLGCINEDVHWGEKLCPAADTPMADATGSFGRISCFGDFGGYVWYTTEADELNPPGTTDYFSNLVWDYGRWE